MPNTAKQEAIRKAYEKEGFKWSQIKNNVNPNTGFLTLTVPRQKSDFEGYTKAVESKMLTSICFNNQGLHMILESLKGISTNNGWIRIESEEDLPKEYGYYHFIWIDAQNNERNEIYKVDNKGINCPPSACITHYQPIVKPEKPIY